MPDISDTPAPDNNNTYVFDSESAEEMSRLITVDRAITSSMGGPLVGIDDPSTLTSILDLACGPGGWALDAAFALPQTQVAGIDISRIMIDYANARARSQQLTNVSFGLMNIMEPLDFDDSSFDLINARLLVAVLLRQMWLPVLTECLRLLRPGGILRLTEIDDMGRTTSPACEQLNTLTAQAFRAVGYGFSPAGSSFGTSAILPALLKKAGFQNIQYSAYPVHLFYGSPTFHDAIMNNEIAYKNLEPLFLKLGLTTAEEMQQLLQNMRIEMYAEDFCGTSTLWTAIGTKPTP